MTIEQKGELFRKRFLQISLGQQLQTRNEYQLLFSALSNDEIQKLDDMNVFFCRSYAPSSVTELKNTPELETMRLIIFEGEYLTSLIPEEVVAIFLHEIGHVFFPDPDLQKREFNADDFAISKGYGRYIKSSLINSMANEPKKFNNSINQNRVTRITN